MFALVVDVVEDVLVISAIVVEEVRAFYFENATGAKPGRVKGVLARWLGMQSV